MSLQIEKHQAEKEQEKNQQKLAQDARLEAEKNYAAEQELAKHRRIREQKAYRDFLFGQMNERKARFDHRYGFQRLIVTRFTVFPLI